MAVVTPLLPFLPLLAKQILLNNFLSDLPSLTIASDRVDPELLARPRRWDIREIQRFMIVFGLVSTLFDLLAFAILVWVFHADETTFHTAWLTISLLTELAVVMVLRTHRPALSSRPGALLVWPTAAIFALAFAMPLISPVAGLFGLRPLPMPILLAIAAIVVAYILATEAIKPLFFRGPAASRQAA